MSEVVIDLGDHEFCGVGGEGIQGGVFFVHAAPPPPPAHCLPTILQLLFCGTPVLNCLRAVGTANKLLRRRWTRIFVRELQLTPLSSPQPMLWESPHQLDVDFSFGLRPQRNEQYVKTKQRCWAWQRWYFRTGLIGSIRCTRLAVAAV